MTSAPPDPAALDASKQMRARLRDMDAHLDQYTPTLVTGADGRIYLAMASLLSGQVDLEPYPFLTPQSRLPALADLDLANLDFANAAAIARIEDRLNEYSLHSPPDSTGQTILGRMNPAGFAGHDFQVLWLGSRPQWLVLPGQVGWPQTYAAPLNTVTTERVFLQAVAGWIVLPIAIYVDTHHTGTGTDRGYKMQVGTPKITANPRQSPPIRSISYTGVDGAGTLVDTETYSTGSYEFPIAYVEPPSATRKSPLIRAWARGSILAHATVPDWLGAFQPLQPWL